jgi:phospholipid/cholesterol/gamma-HCH transport system substrate-binding protein
MEIRARYFLIGLFVLFVAAGVVGFVCWLYNTGGLTERTAYQIRFDGPVAGLSAGSEVLFNGITVGEVTRLRLSPDNPEEVIATIAIDKRTPVRTDTHVGLAFSGLTGTASVALAGGTPSAPAPTSVDGQPPLLVADSAALKDAFQAGRDVLTHLDEILTDNRASLHDAIDNIDTFSAALAANSDKVSALLDGLAKLTGAGGSAGENTIYDLTAPTIFPAIAAIPKGQLSVGQPSAVVALDTQRIIVQKGGGEIPAFEKVRWADSLPLLIQARVIQAFENAGYPRVGADLGPLSADFQLVLDLRQFRIDADGTADVAYAAKVVDADGIVVGSKVFSATQPVATTDDAAAAAAGLNTAFGAATTAMVVWALKTISGSEGGTADQGAMPALDGGAAQAGAIAAKPAGPSGAAAPAAGQ